MIVTSRVRDAVPGPHFENVVATLKQSADLMFPVVLKSTQYKTVAALGECERKKFSNILQKKFKTTQEYNTKKLCSGPVPQGGSLALNNHMVQVKMQVADLLRVSVKAFGLRHICFWKYHEEITCF